MLKYLRYKLIKKVGIFMNYSKETNSLLRKRLRKQKRKTFILFIFGLLIGTSATYAVYYWYPILKKEFDLPELRQITKTTASSKSIKPETSETSLKETTTSSTVKENSNAFSPRINVTDLKKEPAIYETLTQNINQVINQQNVSGTILAVKNNQVILFNNYGKALDTSNDPLNSAYMIGSVQKLVTSFMLMTLIDKHEISLDTPLSDYYPDIPNSKEITIDQMLSMTSGLTLSKKLDNSKSIEESVTYVKNNVTYIPQTKWNYSDVNFFLLATIIEKITGKSYEDYFNETLKEPFDLNHTGFYNDVSNQTHLMPSYKFDSEGKIIETPIKIPTYKYINELGTGNMYVSAPDLLTMIQAIADGKLVSNNTIKETLKKKPVSYTNIYKAGLYDKKTFYRTRGAFGGYETNLIFSKDTSDVILFLGNSYEKDKTNLHLTEEIFKLITNYSPEKEANMEVNE